MAGQEDSNGCINYEGGLSRMEVSWGGGRGMTQLCKWESSGEESWRLSKGRVSWGGVVYPAQALAACCEFQPLILLFLPAFVKHIMAS